MVFSRIPCSYISLDAEDSTGSPQKNVVHEVTRTRLDLDGVPIGKSLKHLMPTVRVGSIFFIEKSNLDRKHKKYIYLAPDVAYQGDKTLSDT